MRPGYQVRCISRRLLARSTAGFRMLLVALPLGLVLALLFPLPASAHAVLLRSDPASQAILKVAPSQVRLWFSEDLNAAFSTLSVVNGANQRVDNQDAQLAPNDARELEVSLKPNLPPAVYIVIWQSDSADDGHVESSSFTFTLARPDGSLPPMSANTTAVQSVPNQQGQWDGPTAFALLAITLLELGAVFWVGAHCWMLFVLPPAGATAAADQADQAEEQTVDQGVRRRFERRLLPFTLLIVLLANSGVLIGQALALTQGNMAKALDPSLLWNLATTSTAGLFWFAREIIALLALRLALYQVQLRRRSPRVNETLQWISLLLGLAFLLALAMSSHAAATPPHILLVALVAEWLHLLAAALWIGGMLFIATGYLPVLRQRSGIEQARSLASVLPSYSPWAVAGVILMAVTGPFIAATRLSVGSQLLTTLYGQVLDIKTALVALLLLTSAAHVFVLQPRLRKAYRSYEDATRQPASAERVPAVVPLAADGYKSTLHQQPAQQATEEVKQAGTRVGRHTRALTRTLGFEAALGVVVLVCVGLLNVFAGTLAPITASARQQPASTVTPQPFHARLVTFDQQFTVTLSIAPNRAGSNHFTVEVINTRTNAVTTGVKVTLNTEMLDMDMGIGVIDLKADGHGRFSANGDLAMSGNWQIIVQIATPNDPYHFHEAYVKLFTPA